MSYALACARPAVFRAVAVLSGADLSGCSGGTQPVSYLGIHGTHDSVLNISAGRALRDTFVRNNGCTAQNPPEPVDGSTTTSGARTWTGGEIWRFFSQLPGTATSPSTGPVTCATAYRVVPVPPSACSAAAARPPHRR